MKQNTERMKSNKGKMKNEMKWLNCQAISFHNFINICVMSAVGLKEYIEEGLAPSQHDCLVA